MNPAYLSPLANHLWQSTLFAGAAGLLTLALGNNRARVRHGVWLAASCKFLVPLSVLMALGGQIHWRAAHLITESSLSVVMDQVSRPFAVPAASSALVAAPPAASPLPAIILGVWACGFLGISCSWWVRWRRIRAAVRAGSLMRLELPIEARSSPALLEPGVFGVIRPVLLLPEGISDRLTTAQLEAFIAHELCHVRHRDNLAAAVHMFVETVFWFHPLVWWIGKRMVEERERACDEEVLRLGSEPRIYAEGILSVCKLYVESPLVCVSGVTGANLKKRIEAIMSRRTAVRPTFAKKAALAVAAAAAVVAPIGVGVLNAPAIQAQSASAATPKFEVASVKLVKDCGAPMVVDMPNKNQKGVKKGGIRAISPGRLHVCTDLGELLRDAYLVYPEDRSRPLRAIEGGPAWKDSELYDVNAKAENAADQATMMGPLLRTLLADRFQLKLHRESREIPVYDLAVAKGGPKLQPTKEGSCTPRDPTQPRQVAAPGEKPFCGTSAINGKATFAEWDLTGGEMAQFAGTLGGLLLDRPVVDKTGLTGMFDIHLQFGLDSPGLKLFHPPLPDDAPSGAPSVFQAVEKLGLKLEPSKGPGDFLVIDRVEKPAGN